MRTKHWPTTLSRVFVSLALAGLVAITLGIAPASAATFKIAVGIGLDTLDPVQMTTTTVANVVKYTVETLTTIDETGKVLPMLAESWTASADGTEHTFKLRKGVTFHDGSPFDAKAVKWNFDRLIDPDVRVPIRASYPIKKTEIVDSHTVKVTLKHPSGPFVGALSWTTSGILSPASVDKHGNSYKNYNSHIVGTGPYTFKERKKGESVTVTKNAAYWGKKPYY
ncbi:MAG: ABC transporter substrate-binding protein, partial [Candidatus Methylomirabilia bacterium]